MPFLIVFAAGAVGGFILRGGTEDVAGVVKWGAIGLVAFIAAKKLNVLP